MLLRTAIVATAASFSFWGALGTFAYSVAVAVVVAGLVTGIRGPRELSPTNRMSDSTNWRTVELVLEGVVFLTMGLEIRSIVDGVQQDRGGVGLAARARQNAKLVPRIQDMQERMTTPEGKQRTLATIDYFLRHPLGWCEGTAVAWAGMRGAVTVVAAQTLLEQTPLRSELVLVAFAVAALSLLVQGGTVGPLVRALAPASGPGRRRGARVRRGRAPAGPGERSPRFR